MEQDTWLIYSVNYMFNLISLNSTIKGFFSNSGHRFRDVGNVSIRMQSSFQ